MHEIVVQENVSLKPYNTFGIAVIARYFVEITSVEMLQKILTDPRWKKCAKLILGGGSNILFTGDFNGLVLKIALRGISIIKENAEHVWLQIAAGENWHDFVLYCLKNNYAGVENLSLIPGTVGAAPIQNIGAYGVEIREVFESLQAMQINNTALQTFNNADCCFGYRDSIFKQALKNQFVICHVTLCLHKQAQFNVSYGTLRETLQNRGVSELSLQAVSDAVVAIRRNKLPDPAQIGNAGSFFKNPLISTEQFQQLKNQFVDLPHFIEDNKQIKIPAAWLIEKCGFKGKRVGDIGVHEKQALVLVNYGSGQGVAIQKLAEEIRAGVREMFAVELMPEVNIV